MLFSLTDKEAEAGMSDFFVVGMVAMNARARAQCSCSSSNAPMGSGSHPPAGGSSGEALEKRTVPSAPGILTHL